MPVVECWICHSFAAPSLKAIIRHIGSVHSNDPNFNVCCGIQGCSRRYKNYHSFRRHFYRKHHNSTVTRNNTTYSNDLSTEDEDENASSGIHDDLHEAILNPNINKQRALFVLKTKEVHKVSQTALNGLLGDVTLLFQRHMDIFTKEIKVLLDSSNYPELLSFLQKQQMIDPFEGLHSKFLQEKFFHNHLGLVVRFPEY